MAVHHRRALQRRLHRRLHRPRVPEALAGGPLGKVLEGDIIEIVIDRVKLEGSVNLVGADGGIFGAEEGTRVLAARPPRPDLAPDPELPPDTRLWAALAKRQRGHLGGLRIRCRGHHPGAGKENGVVRKFQEND